MNQTYQVRHRTLGLYQGEFFGLGFWYPSCFEPEQGICEFESMQYAEEFIYILTHVIEDKMDIADLTIEPFDSILNEGLMRGEI